MASFSSQYPVNVPFPDGDAGTGFGVVGDIGKELYGRIAGARRIVRLVVTAAARKQCGRSED